MHRSFLVTGASLTGLAVILGAFGAHGLKKIVAAETLGTFETAVRYQVYHGIALIITGILYERFRNRWTRFTGYAFTLGIILFCGSLYLLTGMSAANHTDQHGIGVLTPVGGLFFIAGWISMIVSFCVRNHSSLKPV